MSYTECLRDTSNENNIFSCWIVNNHKAHHYNPRGNFNIIFPGADFIFGTYNTKVYPEIVTQGSDGKS